MSARRLDGTAAAAAIRAELTPEVERFRATAGRSPCLAIVLVGDDPASHVYVRNKERAGEEAGLEVRVHRMPASSSLGAVLDVVRALNRDDACDGILVQSPLPAGLGRHAAQEVFDTIDPHKDVDCFHPENVGRVAQGRAVFAPCTPSGVIELLVREGVTIAGKHAVVIGRSEIVGKPMALLLLQHDATVTICHSRTRDLPSVTILGDILVSAIGRPGFVLPTMVKTGATIVDVGTTPITDRATVVGLFGEGSARTAAFDKRGSTVVGDVHPDCATVASALSPVPGGVGPLTIAMLLKNTLRAALGRSGAPSTRHPAPGTR
jgi:methylenetetrahydrofolate dehydrogenase (NADP+)/methenyltetrahydrofolate cyclohydrolase